MKVLVLLALVAMAASEPPRPRQRSAAYAAPAEAPYPPSGWKPSGRQFSLPARQTEYKAPPQDKYGPPPPAAYGPPSTEAPTTTEIPATTTEELETTTDTTTDNPGDNDFSGANADASLAGADDATRVGSGVYYVLLPDGRLQRVAYSTSRDGRELARLTAVPPQQPLNAGFLTLQYQDVQPIREPVYAYGSPLVRLFK